jgi:hypothetical protein
MCISETVRINVHIRIMLHETQLDTITASETRRNGELGDCYPTAMQNKGTKVILNKAIYIVCNMLQCTMKLTC